MPEFLKLIPPVEALTLFLDNLPVHTLQTEELEVSHAAGRVTAAAVSSPEALPAFDRSSMDGFAVRAADTYGCSDSLPAYLALVGEAPMGAAPSFSIGQGQAAVIYTGGMLPPGADAVVMMEYTQVSRPGEVEILRPVAPGENTLRKGEDVAEGELILPAGLRLRPAAIGGLLALGLTQVSVVRRPVVGILSSGDEVIPPQQRPQPGQVRDINTYALSALVAEQGGTSRLYGIIPDSYEVLRDAIRRAWQECDCVIITAGSSASTRDLTARAIQELGDPGVLVHGVAIRPGKPTILAVCGGKPIIGLPGNPVSALVIAGLFVAPLVDRLLGISGQALKPAVQARLAANLPSQAGREDWYPVRLLQAEQGYQAEPIFFKSSLIFNLARADGLVRVPADANGLEAGETVSVVLL